MGTEARRKEIAGDLRRKIGGEAAAAVGELRELVERTQRDMRALAVGMAALEKRVDAAAAAPAAIRRDLLDVDEQLEALRLRLEAEPTAEQFRRVLDAAEYLSGHARRGQHFVHEMTFQQRLRWLFVGRVPRITDLPRSVFVDGVVPPATQQVIE